MSAKPHVPGRPISANTYTNWGCRCDGCRTDHSRNRSRIRAKIRALRARGGSQPIRVIAIPSGARAWMGRGACVGMDMDIFFPAPGESQTPAKLVCGRCPVRQECLEYALTHHEIHGIWGGLSERERRRMTRGQAS